MREIVNRKSLDELLRDGFTRRQAISYLNALENEMRNPRIDPEMRKWAHERGFLAELVGSMGINDTNESLYMSNYEWHKIWPLNDWTRIWINDKMTLKYMLHGTKHSDLMPEYYFYMGNQGLRELIDNPYKGKQDIETLLRILEDRGALAAKPNNGAFGAGFYAMRYEAGVYSINGQEVSRDQLKKIIQGNKNYIYTEFLYPDATFAAVDKNIHTMRVIVMNPAGNSPKILDNITLRFSTTDEVGGNLVHFAPNTPEGLYNMYSHVNIETGEINQTRLCGLTSYVDTEVHPITGVSLKRKIMRFQELKQKLLAISLYFFGVEWMGFDVCMSSKGFKIMEINSHPGCQSAQIFTPLYKDFQVADYITNKIRRIDKLSDVEKKKRMEILR